MADRSFTRKLLEVRVTLQAGQFEGGSTKIITEVPLKVRIEKTGPPDYCKAVIEALARRLEDMAQMSTFAFKPLASAKNTVAVFAGNEADGLSLAFSGSITQAADCIAMQTRAARSPPRRSWRRRTPRATPQYGLPAVVSALPGTGGHRAHHPRSRARGDRLGLLLHWTRRRPPSRARKATSSA